MSSSVDHRRSLYVALLVAGAFFMENLDGTVIATALPQMARSFHTDAVTLNAGMTAYLLSLAMFVPASGWIADRFGARSVFGGAMIGFTAISILCGFCQSAEQFVVARVFQGLAGALMVPVGRLAVLRTTDKRDLIRAIATITWPGLVAPIIGPPLGGWITTFATWRWIFFLNFPLGIIGIALTFWLIPQDHEADRKQFDIAGFVLAAAASACIMIGLDQFGQRNPQWFVAGAVTLAGLGFGYWLVRHSHRVEHPLLDFTALSVPTFAVTMFGGSLFRIAIGATPFLLPLIFQEGMGMNAFHSGNLILAVFAGNLAMKPATTWILKRFGFKHVLVVNGILTAVMMATIGWIHPGLSTTVIIVILFIGGLGRSMQFTALNTLGFADVPPEWMTGANTLSSTIGQITFAAGVAFGAIAVRLSALRHGGGSITMTDYQFAFLLIGLIGLASVYDQIRLPGEAGHRLIAK